MCAKHDDRDNVRPRSHKQTEARVVSSRTGKRHPIRTTIIIVVLLIISLAVGYMLGGVGSVSKVNRPIDEKWNLDGDAPSSSFAESVEPTGPKLSEAKAGAYYLDAIEPSIQPLADAMTVSFSGNLIATQTAAAQAAKALRATAKTLRSRTWPESLTNAITTIADNYANKAEQADYVASSVNDIASEELTKIDAYQVSEADAYLRHKLGLPAATAPTIPLEIVRIEDRGIQQGSDISGLSTNKGKRMLAVTVRSRVPGTLTGLSLSFNLLNGKSTIGSAWGEVRDVMLAEGQSVVVPVAVSDDSDSDASSDASGDASSGDTSSDMSPGGTFAGSRMEWKSLSLTDTHSKERMAAIAASYETSNPDPVLDAFRLS